VLVARAVGSYQWVPFQLLAQGTVQATRPFAVDGWLAPIIRQIYAMVNIASPRLRSVFARQTQQGGPRSSAAVRLVQSSPLLLAQSPIRTDCDGTS